MKFHYSVLAVVSEILAGDGAAAQNSGLREVDGDTVTRTEVGGSDMGSDIDACPVFSTYPENINEIFSYLDAVEPCGHYEAAGCPYEVIPASVTYPGEGPGDLQFIPYITQFDVGLHQTVEAFIWSGASDDQKEKFIGTPNGGETCLEIIVQAGNSGDDATLGGCAGKCGAGCIVGGGWAKDCLKHDVCVTYKNFLLDIHKLDTPPHGFCSDLDCGDEAAQTVMNCFDASWATDESIMCDEQSFEENSSAYGFWSATLRNPTWRHGRCYYYANWARGQGIPGESRISNDFPHLTDVESQGVDNSILRGK
mmetsp:Transcript_5667/g.12347  ORF Transcript_5667/g.12347 Transcript_5667/m.12347 type:complete len:309 (+) Transcript_5667:117-1043(+)